MQAQEIPVYSVSQLTQMVKHQLEKNFPIVWLQGEISNSKLQSSGHFYFSLKDPNAQISAVMFRGVASTLKSIPKDGTEVLVRGELNVYPPSGRYQIVVRELKPVGTGALLLKLEELKQKLHQKGWFNKEHKKPLPKLPKKIGIITSPTGAAIQDILNVLKRRFSGVHLIINPVRVQGNEAAKEIAQAINQMNEHNLAEVLIVGRGGGSIEDLWSFNEEIVAQAIFESKIPIISAVGHQTDYCIADFVADVRAPTPSAAAEIVVAEKSEQINQLQLFDKRLRQILMQKLQQKKQLLNAILKQPLFLSPYQLLGSSLQRFDDLKENLDQSMQQLLTQRKLLMQSATKQLALVQPQAQLANQKQKLLTLKNWLETIIQRILSQSKERLEQKAHFIHSINPKNLLKKGYAIPFSQKDNSVISSVHDVNLEEELKLLLSDGELITKIRDIKHDNKTAKI